MSVLVQTLDEHLYKLRVVAGGTLVLVCLMMFTILMSAIISTDASYTSKTRKKTSPNVVSASYEGPNAVAGSMVAVSEGFESLVGVTGDGVVRGASSVTAASARGGKAVASGAAKSVKFTAKAAVVSVKFVGRTIVNGLSLIASGVRNSFKLMAWAGGNTVTFFSNAPGMTSVIKPGSKAELPVIKPQPATQMIALPTIATIEPVSHTQPAPEVRAVAASPAPFDSAAIWPIHGRITTRFGVPHWPFQPRHTGIDISSGRYVGSAPIVPFKSGEVVNVVHSRTGLGNHVVVDHGGGVTSVYAHLYSISVKVSQLVDTNTVLGYEGSTGTSTGPHLHLEIRVNGQLVDPMQYIGGHP